MPSLKQLLDSAIKNGSSWGIPEASRKVTISFTNTADWTNSYIPPEDGFVFVAAYKAQNIYLASSNEFCSGVARLDDLGLGFASCMLPVKKGVHVAVYCEQTETDVLYYISFFPLRGKS